MLFRQILFVVAPLLFTVGCGGVCDDSIEPAIVVFPYDKSTGQLLCGVEATVVDGSYLEAITSSEVSSCSEYDAQIHLAFEREGNYQVVVSKEGYGTWTSEDIAVTSAGCHVIRNEIDVYLEEN